MCRFSALPDAGLVPGQRSVARRALGEAGGLPTTLRRATAAAGLQPKKCHESEIDLGAVVVRQTEKAQLKEDQHVTRRETYKQSVV